MEKIRNKFYIYRYDIITLSLVFSIILWYLNPLLSSGHIVFSDLDFPLDSSRYLEEIVGLWNNRWNTPTMLNLPRLIIIFPFWLFAKIMGDSGSLFVKSFIIGNLLISSLTIYIFIKSIIRVYLGSENTLLRLLAISLGSLFYTLNPWVIYRIQHIYLLCGYALLPLALQLFFKIFDPKFQEVLIQGYSPFRIKLYRLNILHIGLLGGVISVMSAAIHYFFYTIILIVILWALLLIKQLIVHRYASSHLRRAVFFNFFSKALLLAIITLLFSYYWLSIYLGSILIDAQTSQNNINVVDTLALFSRYSSLDKSLLLISYWWPMFNLKELGPSFYISGYLLILLIGYGVISYVRKFHILLFFTILALLFIIISTGTTIPVIAGLFIKLVMDVPFFGNLFRDPNKLLGIVAICYSIFLVFGVERIFTLSIRGSNRSYIIKLGLFISLLLSFILYITPYRERFINGFYKPVEVPEEFSTIQREFDYNGFRVLNIPLSESMLMTSTGVTTPDWNSNPDNLGYNKATADFSIYQSQKNTLFHHEGSDPGIGYYMHFLQYLLDHGLTSKFDLFAAPLGVDEISYGSGFMGHEERQNFNLDILNSQLGLKKKYENKYFDLFKLKSIVNPNGVVENLIYTPKGLQSFSALTTVPGFDLNSMGVVYSSQNKGNQLYNLRSQDYIESTTIDELMLSSLEEKMYISPGKFVRNGNPFLGWSQSAIHTSDWLWHLKSQNVKPLRFDMSFSSALALSFSSVKLDIPIYEKDRIEGNEYISFEDFIADGYSFTADNSSIVEVETYPLSYTSNLPVIHGIISKGQNYNIWQVGKSGLMPAEEEVPYQFFLTISGKGSNKMHLKARFYDEDKNEIATAYILTPEEKINFEYYKFFGEYITPKKTKFVRIDILTFQRPEQKTYWWIHDFSIKELSEFSAPNRIDIPYKINTTEPLIPYIRLFKSPVGGEVKLIIGGKEEVINTKKSDFSGFLWYRAEKYFPKGKLLDIKIENLGGFNAVNELVLLTEEELREELFKTERAIERGEFFTLLESEYDFDYRGSIQTKRNYSQLSMGKARSSYNGELVVDIDIPADGYYHFSMAVAGEEEKSAFNVVISDNNENVWEERTLLLDRVKSEAEKSFFVDERESSDSSYFKYLVKEDITLENIKVLSFRTKPLKKGRYKVSINSEYRGDSLITIEDMEYFEPSSILVPDFQIKSELNGYSECISLYREMINHSVEDKLLKIEYEKSCSADWYISSSQKVDVSPYNEYLINFDLKSSNLVSRHTKILYLNNNNQVVKTDYIPEVEERLKSEWNNYQYISQAPENAVKMVFQIWGRADKELTSYTYLKDLRFYLYNNLPLVDRVFIGSRDFEEILSIKRDADGSLAIKSDNSPHPIWEIYNKNSSVRSDANLNSVKSLFFINKDGEYSLRPQLQNHYYIGFVLWPITLLLLFTLYKNAKSKESLFLRLKMTLSVLRIKK